MFSYRCPLLPSRSAAAYRYLVLPVAMVASLSAFTFCGCGSERPIESSAAENGGTGAIDSTANRGESETTAISVSSTSTETSPASVASVPPKDSGPDLVVERFLQLLKAGDRMVAEQLLTRTALAVTSRADLQLEPPGSADAKYSVGQVRYATSRKKLAQVDCVVTESIDGEDLTSTVTWMVRLQKNAGWRISGIVLTSDNNEMFDLLSFENPDDVARINQLVAGEEVSDVQHQADAGVSATALK